MAFLLNCFRLVVRDRSRSHFELQNYLPSLKKNHLESRVGFLRRPDFLRCRLESHSEDSTLPKNFRTDSLVCLVLLHCPRFHRSPPERQQVSLESVLLSSVALLSFGTDHLVSWWALLNLRMSFLACLAPLRCSNFRRGFPGRSLVSLDLLRYSAAMLLSFRMDFLVFPWILHPKGLARLQMYPDFLGREFPPSLRRDSVHLLSAAHLRWDQ